MRTSSSHEEESFVKEQLKSRTKANLKNGLIKMSLCLFFLLLISISIFSMVYIKNT